MVQFKLDKLYTTEWPDHQQRRGRMRIERVGVLRSGFGWLKVIEGGGGNGAGC
jgi:hypothetical protein